MKAFYAVAIMAAVVAAANAKAASIQEEHPIGWYDCSQKDDGNYVHPTDCTRFISCSGSIASQRDCANCDVDPVRCPEGRLVYNSTVDACLWADQTRCETDPSNPTTTTQGSTEGTTTTQEQTTTEESTTTTEEPQTGEPCNPDECRNEGYCQSFRRCDKDKKVWVDEECGENLVWNPKHPNGTDHVHGGNCDLWENLLPEIEDNYRSNKTCLACFWEALGDCNNEYLYQPPNGTHRNVLRLSCADGLVFSAEKDTCQRCEDVKRNGTEVTCC